MKLNAYTIIETLKKKKNKIVRQKYIFFTTAIYKQNQKYIFTKTEIIYKDIYTKFLITFTISINCRSS